MPEAAPDVSIVVPVFNEEERLESALSDIVSGLAPFGLRWEVLAVDDGSRDRSAEILAAWSRKEPRVRHASLPRNQGKGEAIRQGVLQARGRYVLFRDADTSVDMKQLSSFEAHMKAGAPVIIGSRRVPGARIVHHQAWLRETMGRCFTWLCRILLVWSVKDFTCGFKCFSAEAARAIFSRQRIRRWAFDAELLFLADKLGYPIVQVPVTWSDTAGTKVRLALDGIRSFAEVLKILAYYWSGRYDLKHRPQ